MQKFTRFEEVAKRVHGAGLLGEDRREEVGEAPGQQWGRMEPALGLSGKGLKVVLLNCPWTKLGVGGSGEIREKKKIP